tara:strand:- start:342 stop:1244 length:903 start_codon:yes stop_codon:yes gene_type:complete
MDELAVSKLRQKYEVIYDPSLVERQDAILELIGKTRAIIVRNKTLVTKILINKASNLSCVGRLGVGLDNIDLVACQENNVQVYPAIGANSNSVAEYVICSAMLLLRRAFQKNIEMISGVWPRQESSGLEVRGKTIGLIGYGEIAQRTSVIAKSLGMKVVAFDPYINASSDLWRDTEKLSLDKLLRVSDVISLHIPLNKETNNLLDEKKLSLVKPSAVLINSARGGILDENALAKALRENRIRGAALDVFSEEPLSEEKAKKFSQLNNIILTPHIAGITEESNERVSQMIADKVEKHLSDI